jgi:hypothetical protein
VFKGVNLGRRLFGDSKSFGKRDILSESVEKSRIRELATGVSGPGLERFGR